MSCRLVKNITHSCEYNPGGITNIYLLDIRDFLSYRFSGRSLLEQCFVEKINTNEPFGEISAVNESSFAETFDRGIYKQELRTFVHTLTGEKSASLLLAQTHKYLIVFRNSQGRMYCFGSDGGASISFTQQTGQNSETSGYQIAISKQSVYPLIEIDPSKFDVIEVLGTENGIIVQTEDLKNAIIT